MLTLIVSLALSLSVSNAHAAKSAIFSPSEWTEEQRRLTEVLREALGHAEEPDFGGRESLRRLEEELWSLNRALVGIALEDRKQIAAFVVRSAVKDVLAHEPDQGPTSHLAWARMFETIASESRFEKGRMLAEVSKPSIDRAEARHRRALWICGTIVGVAEIALFCQNQVAGMIASLPVLGLLTLVGVEAVPGRAVLTQNYVYPALRDCEGMFTEPKPPVLLEPPR
jgi:hypothetical protein